MTQVGGPAPAARQGARAIPFAFLLLRFRSVSLAADLVAQLCAAPDSQDIPTDTPSSARGGRADARAPMSARVTLSSRRAHMLQHDVLRHKDAMQRGVAPPSQFTIVACRRILALHWLCSCGVSLSGARDVARQLQQVRPRLCSIGGLLCSLECCCACSLPPHPAHRIQFCGTVPWHMRWVYILSHTLSHATCLWRVRMAHAECSKGPRGSRATEES